VDVDNIYGISIENGTHFTPGARMNGKVERDPGRDPLNRQPIDMVKARAPVTGPR
jgi:hypothetical protein